MELFDKEYHPVVEEYVVDYADDTLSTTERDAFVEVLAVDDDLRQLATSARDGRFLLDMLRELREIG